MENKEFINKLINYKFANPIYEYVIKEILQPSVDDEILKIFSLYFVFVSNGSSCMPLDYKRLSMEWKNKCDGNYIYVKNRTGMYIFNLEGEMVVSKTMSGDCFYLYNDKIMIIAHYHDFQFQLIIQM